MWFFVQFVTYPTTDEFRLDELRAVVEMNGWDFVPRRVSLEDTSNNENPSLPPPQKEVEGVLPNGVPYVELWLPGEEAAEQVARRCVLVKGIYICYASRPNMAELLDALPKVESAIIEWHGSKTFKYDVESHGRKIPQPRRLSLIKEVLSRVKHSGNVDVKKPEAQYSIFVRFEDASCKAVERGAKRKEEDTAERIDGYGLDGIVISAHFARLVAESDRKGLLAKYSLKTRPYIGTTSMPPELTFVMANLAHVKRGSFVVDCFCGTGSSIVTAAELGAITFGFDMDGRMLRGDGYWKKCVADNYRHYGTASGGAAPPELCRLNLTLHRRVFADHIANGFFDAVLCDPPYGIREPQRQVVVRDGEEHSSEVQLSGNEHSTTAALHTEMFVFAARSLRIGGRLVYWHATTANFSDDELPKHPCLVRRANMVQHMSIKVKRRLVVFEKVGAFDESVPVVPAVESLSLRDVAFSTEYGGDDGQYQAYRAKVQRSRAAATAYNVAKGNKQHRLTRREQRELNETNRAIKKEVAEERLNMDQSRARMAQFGKALGEKLVGVEPFLSSLIPAISQLPY